MGSEHTTFQLGVKPPNHEEQYVVLWVEKCDANAKKSCCCIIIFTSFTEACNYATLKKKSENLFILLFFSAAVEQCGKQGKKEMKGILM